MDNPILLARAAEVVMTTGRATANRLRFDLGLDVDTATRLLDQLESWSVVSRGGRGKRRSVLVSPAHVAMVVRHIETHGVRPPHPNPVAALVEVAPLLTSRQVDVVRLVAVGCSHAEIAGRLGVSVHTVHKDAQSARRALGARTAEQMAVLARRQGLLDECNTELAA